MAVNRKEQREQARAERRAREQQAREHERRRRRLGQLGATLAAAVVIVVVAIAISSSSSSSGGVQTGAPSNAAQVNSLLSGIPQAGLTLGNQTAPVTLIEFADLQCPFCQQYTLSVFPQLVQRYVRAGKVKMVWRNLTFIGQDSVAAAQAAAAAGIQNKLWSFIDIFYNNQGQENSGYVTDAFIRRIASGVPALDVNKTMSDRNSPVVQQQIGQAAQLAQSTGVNSTPTFFVQRGSQAPVQVTQGGQPATSLPELSAALDKALAGK